MKTTKERFIELMGNDVNIFSQQGVDKICAIIDEIAEEKVKTCNLPQVSISVCPKCHASEVYENRNGDGECAICGHTWQTGC